MVSDTDIDVSTLAAGVSSPPLPSKGRSRKRTLTEARREQNRVNQRTFRQKQRAQRREGQHRRHDAPAKNLRLQPRLDHGMAETPIIVESADPINSVLSTVDVESEPNENERILDIDPMRPLSSVATSASFPSQIFPDSDIGTIPGLSSTTPSIGPLFPSPESDLTSIPSDLDLSNFMTDGDLDASKSTTDEESQTALDTLDPYCLDIMGGAWPQSQETAALSSLFPTEVTPASTLIPFADHTQPWTEPHFDIDQVLAVGLEVLYGRRPSANSRDNISPNKLPSPRATGLQFHRNKIVRACAENALTMGYRFQDVIIPKCFQTSPFYRNITSNDDPKQLLAALTTSTTPANLQPTLPQLLYPHPVFMDLIPYPSFRARAITLAFTHPHLVNLSELKKDMVIEDGFVLWSSTGSSEMSNGRRESQGQPWDIRSWEAAPWFLRKWSILIDGEDGEVWKQSRWWQRARGDIEIR